MARHFPYLSAGIATVAVGAITSAVWAAQVPVLHPGVTARPPVAVGGGPSTGTRPVPNLMNTPGTGPAAQPPGFQQSAAFGTTGINQPGYADYYDRLGINPTALEASGGAVPFTSYQGSVGSQVNDTGTTTNPTATTPPNSVGRQFTPTNTGNTVGFYNGFGPGNPNFGFFAGFTTPR